MKIVVASDLHCFKWPEFDFVDPLEGCSRRLVDCLSVFDAIDKVCQEREILNVVLPGDLFHKMGIVEVETYNRTFQKAENSAKKSKLYMVKGNHDQADRAGKQHSLYPFNAIKGVKVFAESTVQTLSQDGESVDVAFIPYCDNRAQLMATVKELAGPPLAFMHVGFDGAAVGSTVEYRVKEPLSPVQVGKHFDFVYTGHYHKLQFVHDNVMYIGSPLEHSRADVTGDQKGILIVDTEDLANPEFIPLKSLPRFLKASGDVDLDVLAWNFVDYQLDQNQKAEDVAAELLPHVRGLRLQPYVEPQPKLRKTERRIRVKSGMSMPAIVKEAVRKRHGGLNQKRLERMMLDILREAEQR